MAEPHEILVFGHRGAMAYEPENTIPSFRKAVDLKVDGIEWDVHNSKDEVPVIIHNETLTEVTAEADTRYVADLTYEVLSTIPVGRNVGREEQIPTLATVMELLEGCGVIANIELKVGGTEDTVGPYLDRLVGETRWTHDLIQVSSFNQRALKRFSASHPGFPIGLLQECIPFDLADGIVRARRDGINVHSVNFWWENGLDPRDGRDYVKAIQGEDAKAHVYTANDEPLIRRLVEVGVDAIISNRPDVVREVIAEYS